MKRIVCFGEVLWDLFPSGKELGGAPANFAYRISTLGCEAVLVSSVGRDALGAEALDRLRANGLDTSQVTPIRSPPPLLQPLGCFRSADCCNGPIQPTRREKVENLDFMRLLVACDCLDRRPVAFKSALIKKGECRRCGLDCASVKYLVDRLIKIA